jgi:tetratricopeptide (TPR) repeat protein
VKPTRSDALCRIVGVFSVSAVFFIVALVSGCAWLSPKTDKPDFSLTEADARQAGALALYSKGLLLESDEDKSSTNVSKEAAVRAFQQALLLEPDNRRALAALVSSLTDRGHHGEALQVLENHLERHPDDIEMRLEAARAADAANLTAHAAKHCAVLLATQPENRELAQALIRLYFQADQAADAFAVIRAQYERFHDSDSMATPVQWAIHFAREGKQPARALECLNLAISQRTNAAERAALITFAAESHLALGQTNAAIASLHRAYQEDPTSTTPVLRLGSIWAQCPDATNQLSRFAQQEKEPENTLLILAATQQALDDDIGAIASLRAYYARRMRAGYFPEESFYLWLGGLLESQNTSDDVEPFLKNALAVHPSSHELKNFLAYLWAEKGVHLDEANRLANEALKAAPGNAAYLDTKGWILFKSGRAFDALQFLLRAAEAEKDEPEILGHVGDVLCAVGRESEAVSFWKRSDALDPQPAIDEKLRKHGVTLPKTP